MPSPDAGLLWWAVQAAAPGAEVAAVRGLRGGGAPWLLRLRRGDADHAVVLRVGEARAPLATEAAALRLAAEHGLPAPRLLAADLNRDPPAVLVEAVEGASTIPPERPPARLRALGRAAAALAAVLLIPGQALPRRDRPIASVDFVALRRRPPGPCSWRPRPGWPRPRRPGSRRDSSTATSGRATPCGPATPWPPWSTGTAPASARPGSTSARCAATPPSAFGAEAAADVLAGWEEAAGRPAAEVARWDVVAALSTPPDMGWFPDAIAGQGRPDLGREVREVLLARRDAFLGDALDRLDGGG
jgi:Phosphotransferase enzyme family